MPETRDERTLAGKPASESASVLAALMEPAHANPMGNIHGGHIMMLVDQAAAAAAIRHARQLCVTAGIDRLDFVNPVHVGDLVTLKASVNYTHRTSMEVGVRVETERLDTGQKKLVASALLIYVAIGPDGKATPIPPVIPQSAAEKRRYRQAELRYRERKQLREKERALIEADSD